MSFRNHLRIRAFVAAATLLACTPAAAQTVPVEAPADPVVAPEPSPPPAPEPAPAPESADAAAARVAVTRARELFRVGDFSAALAEFTRALELLHDDPRQADVLNNIAVCYERMFRYDLALQYYERYLRESTAASADDRAEVEGVMSSLRDLLGTVRITGQIGAEVWIDDRMVGEIPLDVLVPAGLHLIELRAPNHESQRRELRVSARAVHEVNARLASVETYHGLPSTYFWIGTGVTAAALITGSAFGVAALSEDARGDRAAGRQLYADGQKAKDLALQADIAFGAVIALGLGTAVLYFMTDWREQPDVSSLALAPSVALDPGRCAVSIGLVGVLR